MSGCHQCIWGWVCEFVDGITMRWKCLVETSMKVYRVCTGQSIGSIVGGEFSEIGEEQRSNCDVLYIQLRSVCSDE